MDVSIIFVNWNSVNYLRECLASIYEHTQGITFEIIVVDNASPEGGVDALKEEFPDIVLIKSGENLGFAGANNVGFKKSTGNFILFLNPDTKLLNPAINILLESFKSLPNAGIVGCKLLNADLSVQASSIMRFPGILNQVLQSDALMRRWPSFPVWNIGPLFSNDLTPAKVEAITGACMMMRREVFEKVGMFSEEYFMYAEDVDLCWKVTRAGFSNYYVGRGNVLHYGGVSSPREWQIVMKMKAEQQLIANFRGRFYGFLFRATLGLNAALRLMLTIILRTFKKPGKGKEQMNTASLKYRAVLRTFFAPSTGSLHPPKAAATSVAPSAKNA